jgi:hypothetical protein
MNSLVIRRMRHVSVRVKSRRSSLLVCRSFSSSVTGGLQSRMDWSMRIFVAPERRAGASRDGGRRPAARCPSSVRSRSPSRDSASASAAVAGFAFFPVAVRRARTGFCERDVFGVFEFFLAMPLDHDRVRPRRAPKGSGDRYFRLLVQGGHTTVAPFRATHPGSKGGTRITRIQRIRRIASHPETLHAQGKKVLLLKSKLFAPVEES